MSSENDDIKNALTTEQEEFKLKGADDYPYDFSDLCDEHQRVAQTILDMYDRVQDKNIFKHQIKTQFKLGKEIFVNKDENPLVKHIESQGCFCAIQGHVTEADKDGNIVKYPVVSFVADTRQYEKVYRSLVEQIKEYFVHKDDNSIK